MNSNEVSVNILATDCNMTQYCPAKQSSLVATRPRFKAGSHQMKYRSALSRRAYTFVEKWRTLFTDDASAE